MAQSNFDRVSGTSEYERQSWRDSFNGGRAAGDWSGGVNDRLDRERERFQGATEGGSSTQPSGLQWAQMLGATGVGFSHVGGSSSAGPGNSGASNGAAKGGAVAGPGVPASPQAGPLKITIKDKGTGLMMGGDWWKSNPWWSDGEEWEARYAEPGEWLGGALTIGADTVFNLGRFVDAVTGAKTVSPRKERTTVRDLQQSGDGAWPAIQQGISDWFGYHSSFRDGSYGGQSTPYHTGGGF